MTDQRTSDECDICGAPESYHSAEDGYITSHHFRPKSHAGTSAINAEIPTQGCVNPGGCKTPLFCKGYEDCRFRDWQGAVDAQPPSNPVSVERWWNAVRFGDIWSGAVVELTWDQLTPIQQNVVHAIFMSARAADVASDAPSA